MRKTVKRTAVAAMAGMLAVSCFAGCGEKKLDGSATVATVNGTAITMGTASLAARHQQAQIEAMYLQYFGAASGIWDDAVGDEEESYGEQTVSEVVENLEREELLRQKAPEYNVELTEEENAAIKEAAASFMEANTEETIAELAVTEADVITYLELATYQSKMTQALYDEVDVEVSDEEAQQCGFTYVSISIDEEELTEEDITKKKEQAQEILDKMKADPSADMGEIAKEVDETLSALTGTFDAVMPKDDEESTSSYPEDVIAALRGLEEGQMADEVIEAEGSLYIVRFDTENDEDATASKKESLKAEKQSEYYNSTVEEWMEAAEIKVDEKVLKTLKITDNHKFTIQYNTEEEDAETEVSDEEAETLEEPESEDAGEEVEETEVETIDETPEETPEETEE